MARRLLATVQGGNPTLAIAAIQKQELMQAQIDDLVRKDFFRGIQASNLERRLAQAEFRRVLPHTFGGLRGGMDGTLDAPPQHVMLDRMYELEATYVTDNYVDDKLLAIADDLDRVG